MTVAVIVLAIGLGSFAWAILGGKAEDDDG